MNEHISKINILYQMRKDIISLLAHLDMKVLESKRTINRDSQLDRDSNSIQSCSN